MPIDYNAIGKRIKAHRLSANMTQEGLAEKLDISVSFQSRLERGAAKISFEKLVATSEQLNVSVSELIAGVNENSQTYLNADLQNIVKNFSKEKMRLLLNIAEAIAKSH